MKKLNRFAALAAIILLLVMGCKVEPDAIAVESVSLSETTLTIELGKTRRLTATINDNAGQRGRQDGEMVFVQSECRSSGQQRHDCGG